MKTAKRTMIVVLAMLILTLVFWTPSATAVAASPLPHGETGPGGLALSNWKAILTTVVLLLALLQFLSQAVVRGWIKSGNKKLWARLHRPGGIITYLLVLVVLGLCLYVMFGPNGGGLEMLSPTRVILHAIFGGLLLLVLTAKAIISNFARRQLRVNGPLGIAAGVLTLGLFLASVVPHVFRFG